MESYTQGSEQDFGVSSVKLTLEWTLETLTVSILNRDFILNDHERTLTLKPSYFVSFVLNAVIRGTHLDSMINLYVFREFLSH